MKKNMHSQTKLGVPQGQCVQILEKFTEKGVNLLILSQS